MEEAADVVSMISIRIDAVIRVTPDCELKIGPDSVIHQSYSN